jgi:hypothetical protein
MRLHRLVIAGVFPAAFVLSGLTSAPASGEWACLRGFIGGYSAPGGAGEQCVGPAGFLVFGYNLYLINVPKEIAPGVLCALVEAGEVSLYDGSSCGASEEHKGESEYAKAFKATPSFSPSSKQKFSSSGGPSTLKSGSDTVSCASLKGAGEITGLMEVGNVVVDWTGCKSSSETESGCSIKSKGATAEGLIKTNTLRGSLGLTLTGSYIGLLLLPSSGKTVTELSSNACTPESKVTGEVAGEESPIDQSQVTGKVVFAVSSSKQAIREIATLSGVSEPELVAFGTVASERGEESITYESAIEIT